MAIAALSMSSLYPSTSLRYTSDPMTTSGDTTFPLVLSHYPYKTVTLAGTFGGATAILEGTNDGINWFQCFDTANVAISLTANGMRTVRENPMALRWRLTAGAGASLIADFVCTSNNTVL